MHSSVVLLEQVVPANWNISRYLLFQEFGINRKCASSNTCGYWSHTLDIQENVSVSYILINISDILAQYNLFTIDGERVTHRKKKNISHMLQILVFERLESVAQFLIYMCNITDQNILFRKDGPRTIHVITLVTYFRYWNSRY